ncbi:hypothetical protein Tsubulata_029106 [Turnera subulata]|uniref:Myb-like domain-containing protein n=1 Tax=Turnera subulata TaxID=218843 RepID=A0A9Q0F6I5_9ROSI|nr:hypothetical protein Tsubulata_029106 [Turnera subulata]
MGRAPCCSKVGLHRGPWTQREDTLLSKYIEAHGEGHWRSLPKKAEADLLQQEAAKRRRSNNNNKNTAKRQKAAAKTEKPKVHLPKPVRLTSLRLQRNDSFECNTNVSTGSSSQEKEVCFGAETVDEVPSWCKYFKNGGGDYENGASFLVEEVNASDDLECQSPGPITNSLEKLYEEYLQLLKTDDDQAQLDSFAESLLL